MYWNGGITPTVPLKCPECGMRKKESEKMRLHRATEHYSHVLLNADHKVQNICKNPYRYHVKKLSLSVFFGGLEYVGHSVANVTLFVFLRDIRIRTQRAAVASRRATNLATHPFKLCHPSHLQPSPSLDTPLPP
jgi:hypothetical protein